MRQQNEIFHFFSIADPPTFKRQVSGVISQITTVESMLDPSTQPHAMTNIAFSQSGLTTLGIHDDVNDTDFRMGQFASAPVLAENTDNWVDQFKGTKVHGVFMIASDSQNLMMGQSRSIQNQFGRSINILYSIQGQMRPGNQAGHERKPYYYFFALIQQVTHKLYARLWFFGRY